MDTKKIGAFIAMNRKKKGYTQEQLAEKLGVSNKTISRWENGHSLYRKYQYFSACILLKYLTRYLQH